MCEVWLLISVQSGKEIFSTRKDFETDLSLRQQWESNYMLLSLPLALILSPFPLFLFSLSFLPPHQSLSINLPFLSSFHSVFFFLLLRKITFRQKQKVWSLWKNFVSINLCRCYCSLNIFVIKELQFYQELVFFFCLGNVDTSNWKWYDVKEAGICNFLISISRLLSLHLFFLISLLPAYTIWIGFQMESLIEGSTHVSGSFQTDGISIFPK